MGVAANYEGAIPAAIAPKAGGLHNTIYARETGYGTRRRTVIEFKDHIITGVDDAGVVGKFVEKIYTFPVGRILFEGASADVQIDYSSAGVNSNADGDIALGTAVGAGNALTTTEQNLIQTSSTLAAASEVLWQLGSQAVSSSVGAPLLIDGSAGAIDVYLNHIVDDADQDITGTPCDAKLNGELVINWVFVGVK